MELSAALTADINDLCTSVAADPDTVMDPLRALNRDLRLTTRSYLGFELVLHDHGRAITLTSFEPGVQLEEIVTSLHLPIAVLGLPIDAAIPVDSDGGRSPDSSLTLYAGRPGALVDLAADLSYALVPGRSGQPEPKPAGRLGSVAREVVLDQHLTPRSLTAGVTGSHEASTVNRAVGLLIGRGQTPEEAHRDLANQAAFAGVSVVAWSAQLLRPVGQSAR